MGKSLYTKSSNEIRTDCPYQPSHALAWSEDLPWLLKDLVVTPVSFDMFQEYEMLADRICGRDAANQPCYCAFRLIRTQLRSDDDEVFYELPVYAETLTCWRLVDERWLTCRTTMLNFDDAAFQTHFSVSEAMPR